MELLNQLTEALDRLAGTADTGTSRVNLTGPSGIQIAMDISAADSMSCSLRELRLCVPGLANAGFEMLKTWAARLSERITYLLENIEPLEVSAEDGAVLIRSSPPDRHDAATTYYDILVESQAEGCFTLRRYCRASGSTQREVVAMQLTREVLKKLVTDLVATVPE